MMYYHPMGRVLILTLIALLNLGACSKEVNWETFPQIRSMTTRGAERAWLVTIKGDLLRTDDGGKTWQNTPATTIGGFQSTTMLDDLRGFAVNNHGKIWSTINGGKNWVAKGELRTTDWHFNESDQIQFMDELHGWNVETLTIWRTEDGGANWQKAFSPFDHGDKGQPVRAFFLNLRNVWVCGTDGEVYNTKDDGQTWTTQTISGKDSDFTDIFFTNEKTGWLAGYIGGQLGDKLYHTNDGGKTWQLLSTAISQGYLNSIYFFDEKEGWACGDAKSAETNGNSEKAMLMHTTDGGQSWQTTLIKDDEPFFDRISFVDSKHGWLFGRDHVYRTDDGGKSWHTVLNLPPIKATR